MDRYKGQDHSKRDLNLPKSEISWTHRGLYDILNSIPLDAKSFLDVGCGTGVVADELAHKLKIKVVGCDIDQYLVRKIPFRKMVSGSKLPFRIDEFDSSMLNDVLHHTPYSVQEKLLSEGLRVAKQVFIFELKPTVLGKILDYVINKFHNPRMAIPFTYRSESGWEELFRRKNIKFEKKKRFFKRKDR